MRGSQPAARLPLFVRSVDFEGWDPSTTPAKLRDKPDFIARACDAFTGDQLDDPEQAVAVMFSFLNTHISAGEINDVRRSLRNGMRGIRPAPRG